MNSNPNSHLKLPLEMATMMHGTTVEGITNSETTSTVQAGAMKLTYDVLFLVMQIQSLSETVSPLSAMSQTCHTLYREGVKYLMDREITLRNDRDVISFALFVLADEERRLPLFRRSFCVKTGLLSEEAGLALANLMSRVTQLRRLALYDADQVLASNPRLPHVFASLTSLKHLEFHATQDSDNSDCVYVFKRMQSRLVTATLDLPAPISRWMNGHLNCELVDPIGLLRNSASTLTELRGTNFEARRNNVIYPEVKRLQIHLGLVPYIPPYIISFPNVSHVEVSCGTPFEPSTAPQFAFMNELGMLPVGCWTTLEELSGNLMDLYVLSLRSTVADLRVRAFEEEHRYLSYLKDVLSRARPVRLQLEVDSSAFESAIVTEDSLVSVFDGSDAGDYVRNLDIRIRLRTDDLPAHLDDVFERVIESVKHLPLASFRIQFHHAGPSCNLTLARQQGTRASAPSRWDTACRVDRVRKACPSLRELVVERAGYYDSENPFQLLAVHFGDF